MFSVRAFALIAALATSACGGRARSAVDWEHKAPFQRGTALKHVPAECAGGHMFLDLPAVEKNEATRAAVDVLAGRFFAGMATSSTDRKVIVALEKALRDEGLDPARDTKEIALCYRGPAGVIAVFAGDYSGKDIFGAVEKAAKQLGDKPPKIEEKNHVEFIRLGSLRVARVAPNVVVLGEDISAMVMLNESNDRSEQWGYQPGHVGFARLGGEEPMFISFTDKGADVEVELVLRAGKTLATFEGKRESVADRFAETPLKDLAPAVRTAKIEIKSGVARIVLRGQSGEIARAIHVASELSPGELKKILGYVFGGGGGNDPSSPGEHKI